MPDTSVRTQQDGEKKWHTSDFSDSYSYYDTKLHDIGDSALENRINKIARRMIKIDRSTDNARFLSLRTTLANLCFKYFYVRVNGKKVPAEDCLTETIIYALGINGDKTGRSSGYQNPEGEFTHLVRKAFKNKCRDIAGRSGKIMSGVPDSKELHVRSIDALQKDSEGQERDDDNIVMNPVGETYYGADERMDEKMDSPSREEAIIIQTIAIMQQFKEKTGRSSNSVSRLYSKLFFSETICRMVRGSELEDCVPLERHQRDVMKSMELPFQDTYTKAYCRSIRELWHTRLVSKHNLIDPKCITDASKIPGWKLPQPFFVEYVSGLGIKATNVQVSQQRKNFHALLSQLRDGA